MSEVKDTVASGAHEEHVGFILGGHLTSAVSEIISRVRLPGNTGMRRPGFGSQMHAYSEAGFVLPMTEYHSLRKGSYNQGSRIHTAEQLLMQSSRPKGYQERRLELSPEVAFARDRRRGLLIGFQAVNSVLLDEYLKIISDIDPAMVPNDYSDSQRFYTTVPPGLINADLDTLNFVHDKLNALAAGKTSSRALTIGSFGIIVARTRPRIVERSV